MWRTNLEGAGVSESVCWRYIDGGNAREFVMGGINSVTFVMNWY